MIAIDTNNVVRCMNGKLAEKGLLQPGGKETGRFTTAVGISDRERKSCARERIFIRGASSVRNRC